MHKCKCIKRFNDTGVFFIENSFYDYEYIPPMANYPPSYRVYYDFSVFRGFSLIEFKKYFQKY